MTTVRKIKHGHLLFSHFSKLKSTHQKQWLFQKLTTFKWIKRFIWFLATKLTLKIQKLTFIVIYKLKLKCLRDSKLCRCNKLTTLQGCQKGHPEGDQECCMDSDITRSSTCKRSSCEVSILQVIAQKSQQDLCFASKRFSIG